MKLIDKKVYKEWKANQGDDAYGLECFNYAERWANLMEKSIKDGEKIEDIADSTSHEADTTIISGFMYGAAVSILSKCWVHGETLRQWHNLDTQIGTEGEKANKEGGTLNPALLNIATN